MFSQDNGGEVFGKLISETVFTQVLFGKNVRCGY